MSRSQEISHNYDDNPRSSDEISTGTLSDAGTRNYFKLYYFLNFF